MFELSIKCSRDIGKLKIVPKYIMDIGVKYFSSSTDDAFVADQKLNQNHYKYKIVKEFGGRKDANDFEVKLHERLNLRNKFSAHGEKIGAIGPMKQWHFDKCKKMRNV